MPGNFTASETLNMLRVIFEKHRNERVCVVGTICTGKSTLFTQLPEYNCEDLDDALWPNLPKEAAAHLNELNKPPWTAENGSEIHKIISTYGRVKPGRPLFGTTILCCEAVVYLDIPDALLMKHCKKRGDSFDFAKKYKEAIESDWNAHKVKGGKTFYYLTVTE
ncbi:MAG: hypothetical protein FWC78_03240 [Defluviitaleaceae bacterium]|nr:hypothetical protein [Defluviitaleaceae bacterium]